MAGGGYGGLRGNERRGGLLLPQGRRGLPAGAAHAQGHVDLRLRGAAEGHLLTVGAEHDLTLLLHLEAALLEATGERALLVAEAEALLALLLPVLRRHRGAEELPRLVRHLERRVLAGRVERRAAGARVAGLDAHRVAPRAGGLGLEGHAAEAELHLLRAAVAVLVVDEPVEVVVDAVAADLGRSRAARRRRAVRVVAIGAAVTVVVRAVAADL